MAEPEAPPKVELRDVGLRYFGREGETEAITGISLAVGAGEESETLAQDVLKVASPPGRPAGTHR